MKVNMSLFDAVAVRVGGVPPGHLTVGPPFHEAMVNPPVPELRIKVNLLPADTAGNVMADMLAVSVSVCMLPLVRLMV
jgi:hypothetical protein